MQTTTVAPVKLFHIRVGGGSVDVARDAVAKHLGTTMLPGVNISGYGAVHARVYTDADKLAAWFASEHDLTVPGILAWYNSV